MRRIAILLLSLILAGCAKFPQTGGGNNTRLVFTMTVDGVINPDRFYVVAIRWSKDSSPRGSGPVPVIAQPWGNGFVAGRANVFMRYEPSNPAHPYVLYRFTDPIPDNGDPVENQTYLLNAVQIGYPVDELNVEAGGKSIRFELDMSQIAESAADIPLIQAIQVNFLTMDRIPSGSDTVKHYDGIGNTLLPSGINEWLTIPVTRDGIYNNSTGINQGIEPRLDTEEPDIDIVDWQIEVRRP